MCSETYGGTGDNVLFLIDDCANQKSCELTRLAFSGRHLGISVWFITQKYKAVVKDFRDNVIRALVQFYEKDENSLKAALSGKRCHPKGTEAGCCREVEEGKKIKTGDAVGTPLHVRCGGSLTWSSLALNWSCDCISVFSSIRYITSRVTW
jgi:hypothetical protein